MAVALRHRPIERIKQKPLPGVDRDSVADRRAVVIVCEGANWKNAVMRGAAIA
jgi:hypothetical protein